MISACGKSSSWHMAFGIVWGMEAAAVVADAVTFRSFEHVFIFPLVLFFEGKPSLLEPRLIFSQGTLANGGDPERGDRRLCSCWLLGGGDLRVIQARPGTEFAVRLRKPQLGDHGE